MSVRKNLQLLVASSLLVTLASCGNDSKSKKTHREINPVCSEIDCLSSINWKIELQGRAFPERTRIDINGTTVLNECVSKQRYSIDRWSEPAHLYLENFYIPKRGQLRIDVVDLGSDCSYESSFISDDDVEFEVTKSSERNEILIRL